MKKKNIKILITILVTFLTIIFFKSTSYANTLNYMYIGPKVTLQDIIYKLDAYNDVFFKDVKNKKITDYTITSRTGLNVMCTDSENETTKYKLVVKGDANGDGIIDEEDINIMKKDRVNLVTLEDEFLNASDQNNSNEIELADLRKVRETINTKSETKEDDSIKIAKITLNVEKVELIPNESFQLKYTITPDNVEDDNISFTSEDTEIAEVDEKGLIKAKKNGKTTINISSSEGIKTSCEVEVYTELKKLELNVNQVKLATNGKKEYQLQANFIPADANKNTNITWSSLDENIATVDNDGKIKAVGNGTTTIKATNENGIETTCEVSVYTVPEKIEMSEKIAILEGSKGNLKLDIQPENANIYTEISYKIENENIISISEDGTIQGLHQGTTKICISTANEVTAECEVVVYKEITDFSLESDYGILDLSYKNTYSINAFNDQKENINGLITWESQDENIATVNENGEIQGISNGTTIIKAKLNENIEKDFTITVQTSPKEITIPDSTLYLTVGDEPKKINYEISPNTSNANTNLTWISSNNDIAKVNEQGEVQAISEGRATLTVRSENGIEKTCKVIIAGEYTTISFNKKQILLPEKSTGELVLTFNIDINDINLDELNIQSDNEEIIKYNHYEKIEEKQIKIFLETVNAGRANIIANMGEQHITCDVIVYSQSNTIGIYKNEEKLINRFEMDINYDEKIFNLKCKTEENIEITENVEWSSSNEDVATIEDNGQIEMKNVGTTNIKAKINDEIYKQIELKIEASPKYIKVDNTNIHLYVNGTENIQIKSEILPANTTINNQITYKSSDENIATVNDNGEVKAISSGIANIELRTQNNKTANVTVNVHISPSKIYFNEGPIYMQKGIGKTLKPIIEPSNVNAQSTITWNSSNTDIITVDNYGNIKAIDYGEATITATTTNGKSTTINVIVPKLVTNLQKIELDLSTKKSIKINTDGSTNIGKVKYSSTNTNCVTVDEQGNVTAKANGSANINITESNTNTNVTIPVKVITTTTSIKLNKTNISLDIANAKFNLVATQNPTTITNKKLKWSSSNTNVATVNSSGVVTRVSPGKATITAEATDGSNKSSSCVVNVKNEKMIIIGASTISQIASRRKCSETSEDYWKPNYFKNYGYKVRTSGSYYNYLKSSEKGTTDKAADLFFVCASGTGYKWLTGSKPYEYLTDTGTAGAGEKRVKEIIDNNSDQNCHFTIAYLTGGNDLKAAKTKDQVNNIADLFAKYYKKIASKYPEHNFYIFPVTPVDETNASEALKKSGYNTTSSNNTKRYRFACQLNSDIGDGTTNLKYAKGFYNYFKDLEEKRNICRL